MRVHGNSTSSLRSLLMALLLCLSMLVPEHPLVIQEAIAQGSDPRATTGAWDPVNNWGIFGKHMALMHNGKVLVWPTGQDAYVWDPATNTKTPVPATFGDLHCAAQVTLADGRVLVAGGVLVQTHDGINVTALFDPVTNQWTEGQPMEFPRWYGTTTTLGDGRVLVVSGDMPGGGRANIPEVYDPIADEWTTYPAISEKDLGLYPFMFVLPNGKVYNAGTKKNTFYFDTDTGAWSNGPSNSFGSSGYAESGAMYEPGKIIRSGGSDPAYASAAIIDTTVPNPKWTLTEPMKYPRRRHNMVILADGQVMAIGGTRTGDDLSGAVYAGEIWNPATGKWTETAPMSFDRMYHSAALLLPDGSVLTAGGEYGGRKNAQIFKPPYFFKGTRPKIASNPSVAAYGTNFQITIQAHAASISSVALIRPAAVTHAFDHNQRYVPLAFTQNGNQISATAPIDGNTAPPGYYMLVVKDSNGLPSEAGWIRIDRSENLVPGSVSGTVRDGNGNPISGATITYGDQTTTTNGSGQYTIPSIMPGQQHISASKGSAYAEMSHIVTVISGQNATLDFVLTPPGTLTGQVTDSDSGEPIAGAVVLRSGGNPATTNENGVFTFTNIPSGAQKFTTSAEGYESSAEETVIVVANTTTTHDITLTPKPTYIAGEIRDKVTNELVPFATVSDGISTVTADDVGRYLIVTPPGTYTLTVEADGYEKFVLPGVLVTFGNYTAVDPLLEPRNAPIISTPVADSYVRPSEPTNKYGDREELIVRSAGSDTRHTYLRFDVSGITRPIQSATLRLFVSQAHSTLGGQVVTIDDHSWEELEINYENAPPTLGRPMVGNLPKGAVNEWVELDITSAVSGNGPVSLAIISPIPTDGFQARYHSKEHESGNAPQLYIVQEPPPWITTFTPSSGLPGSSVTIYGENFNDITDVQFNGVSASSFTRISDTEITAVVPNTATSGKISVVSSTTVANSVDEFTVIPPPPPIITLFTPTSGPAGTRVTISGNNFIAVTQVSFNGIPSTNVTVKSTTQLEADVPAGATTGIITVTTAGGSANSGSNFTVTQPAPPPTITSFSPASGPAGTEVLINGTNFIGVTDVQFNNASASSFTIVSTTAIRAIVPSSATSGKVKVTTYTGSATSSANFTVTEAVPPTITGFSPASGQVGTEVIINGTNFIGVTQVTFTGRAASFEVDSPTRLRAIVPSGASSGKLKVTTLAGSATSSANFTVLASQVQGQYLAFIPMIVNGATQNSARYAAFEFATPDNSEYLCKLD